MLSINPEMNEVDQPDDDQLIPFDAYDADAVKKAEKRANRIKKKKLRVVQSIMSNEDGRAWMYDFLGINCHVFMENQMNGTAERNGRFEGERAVGLRVLDEIMQAAPEQFWTMRLEALKRAKQ